MDFDLLCPCCNARLKIDTDLKAVIAHEAAEDATHLPVGGRRDRSPEDARRRTGEEVRGVHRGGEIETRRSQPEVRGALRPRQEG